MKCPYCNQELKKGYIYGDRYALKWLEAEKNLFLGLFVKGGLIVSDHKSMRPKVLAYNCEVCKKMIVDY